MQHATFEDFSNMHDALKTRCRCSLGNLFLDRHALHELLEKKTCLLHAEDHSLFLLVPMHGAYHDCFYMAKDADALESGMTTALAQYQEALPIRASVVGKEEESDAVAALLQRQGFALIKKLLRFRLPQAKENILEAMRPYAEEYKEYLSFATKEDAEEALEILRENFDLMGDNIPELEDIQKHIAKGQVAVLRQGGRIASLQYFSIQHGTFHSLYDVTRKEYRGGNGFFLGLAYFIHTHLLAQGRQYQRVLGWRDAAKQKLVKHAKKSNQHLDGIVIHNLLWTPGNALPRKPEAVL